MKFVTLLPMSRNDGSAVSESEMDSLLGRIWETFGGCTIEGQVTGHWIDSQDGKHYQDTSLKVVVVIEPERIDEARELVREIGKQLGQIEMYFELINTQTEFLKV
jgi:hypothetical protein